MMEYADEGTLEDFLRKRTLSSMQRLDLIAGLVSGLRSLHKIHIAHRDLSLGNALIRSLGRGRGEFVLKVADFGYAEFLDPKYPDRVADFCKL